MLVPVIGLVQVGEQAYADRYTYLPSIGLYLAVGCGLRLLLGGGRMGQRALLLITLAVSVCLTIVSRGNVPHWKDNYSLFGQAVAVTEHNHVMEHNYGLELYNRGQKEKAEKYFRMSIVSKPEQHGSHTNLGVILAERRQYDEAIKHFLLSLQYNPTNVNAHLNLAKVYQLTGRIPEARRHFSIAAELDPTKVPRRTKGRGPAIEPGRVNPNDAKE